MNSRGRFPQRGAALFQNRPSLARLCFYGASQGQHEREYSQIFHEREG